MRLRRTMARTSCRHILLFAKFLCWKPRNDASIVVHHTPLHWFYTQLTVSDFLLHFLNMDSLQIKIIRLVDNLNNNFAYLQIWAAYDSC